MRQTQINDERRHRREEFDPPPRLEGQGRARRVPIELPLQEAPPPSPRQEAINNLRDQARHQRDRYQARHQHDGDHDPDYPFGCSDDESVRQPCNPRNGRRPPPHGRRPTPPRNNQQHVDHDEQPRPYNRDDDPYGIYKFKIPSFAGESDPDVYLAWELKVYKIFRMKNYNEDKKVALACLEFEDYANLWWDQVQNARQDRGDPLLILGKR